VVSQASAATAKPRAIAQTQNLIASGARSIDVGCMQVNLKHHPRAFANLNQAFDPETNVAYAATFLHDNYATLGDWIKATAAYHSRTPIYGQQYLVDIERNWNRIVGKVAQARASKAAGGTAPTTVAAVAQTPRVVSSAKPMQDSRHVRVIQVNDALRQRNSEVLVVKPSAPSAPVAPTPPVTVADASATPLVTPDPAASIAADSVRRVSLDNTAASALPAAKETGPKFVFAN